MAVVAVEVEAASAAEGAEEGGEGAPQKEMADSAAGTRSRAPF